MSFLAPIAGPLIGSAIGGLFGNSGAGGQAGQALGNGLGAEQAAQQNQAQAWANAQKAAGMETQQTQDYVNQLLALYSKYQNPALGGNIAVSGVTNVAGAQVPGAGTNASGYLPYFSPTGTGPGGSVPSMYQGGAGIGGQNGNVFTADPTGPGGDASYVRNAQGLYNYNGNSKNPSEATGWLPTEQAAQNAWMQKYGSK